MTLPQGYKFIYTDWKQVSPAFVRKDDGTDVVVISYDDSDNYIDLKTFKFIYSDGEYLVGRNYDGSDVNFVLKADGVIIMGKKKVVPVAVTRKAAKKIVAEPVAEVAVDAK